MQIQPKVSGVDSNLINNNMTVTLTLRRVNPDASITVLSSITMNSTALLPSNFTIVDYPTVTGNHMYQVVATSSDADSIVFNNLNLSLIYLRR